MVNRSKIFRFFGIAFGVFFLFMLIPFKLNPYHDFSVVFFTNKAFLQGIPIYSYAQQLEYIKLITPVGFEFHPFPYPPWFALVVLFLGMFDIFVAMKVWFFINIAFTLAAIWLLTDGWERNQRLIVLLLSALYTPFLGLLLVGQFTGPILWGATLILVAYKKQDLTLVLIGMFLLTFKPHLGVPILIGLLIWIIVNRDGFGKTALIWFTGLMAIVGVLSFVMDPKWPINYTHTLLNYSSLPGVVGCDQCASLLSRIILYLGPIMSQAGIYFVALSIILITAVLIARFAPHIFEKVDGVIFLSIFLTLLFLPYILSYDYILLLVPWVGLLVKNKGLLVFPLLSYLVIFQSEKGGIVLPILCLILFAFFLFNFAPRKPFAV